MRLKCHQVNDEIHSGMILCCAGLWVDISCSPAGLWLSTLFGYSTLLQILLPHLQLRVIDSHLHTNPCTQLTRKGFPSQRVVVDKTARHLCPHEDRRYVETEEKCETGKFFHPLSGIYIHICLYLNVGHSPRVVVPVYFSLEVYQEWKWLMSSRYMYE